MKRVVAIAALGVVALTARRHLTMRNALKSVSADLRSPFLKFYTPLVNAQTLPLLRAALRLRMRPGAGVRVTERHLLGEPAVRVLSQRLPKARYPVRRCSGSIAEGLSWARRRLSSR